jgi:para-nitrobenzyl esterase
MSWHRLRTSLFVMLAFAVPTAACDLDLDDNDDDDEESDNTRPIGGDGTSSGGGGFRPRPDDDDCECSEDGDGEDGEGGETDPDDPDGFVSPRVTVDQGELEGIRVDDGVRAFLGVPYAKPPVDELRWAPAEDPTSWLKVRSATSFGPRCAQPGSSRFDSRSSQEEDCLYLNVWAPPAKTRLRAPVMFWIHGGDHTAGSGAEAGPSGSPENYYDGSLLAAKGVVVVTANYRLGALGFLTHPGLYEEGNPSGNQGLRDQQFALRWVHENIVAFGGDPNNVTIFGQGSGAEDVCMHVVAPESRTLFQQAISESGGCTTYQSTIEDVSNATDRFIADVGCDDARDQLRCLRDVPVRRLLDATPEFASPFRPVVDADFLPDQPRVLFDEHDFAGVPYILGTNAHEGSWFAAEYEHVANEDDYHAFLKETFPDVSLDELCACYPDDEFGEGVEALKRSLARILVDARFACVITDTALRANEAGATVYRYEFDASGRLEVGSGHGAEIGYVFGTAKLLSADHLELSDIMQAYWTNFARRGDPNSDILSWPDFSAVTNVTMELTLEPEVVRDLRSRECDFWRAVYAKRFE